MLDGLPDDILIGIVDYLLILDLVSCFRPVNRRFWAISRLPVVWARICRDYSIVSPSDVPSQALEARIGSIALLDDHLHRSSYSPRKVDVEVIDVDYPSNLIITPGGEYALVSLAVSNSLYIMDVTQRKSRRLEADIKGFERPLCAITHDFGDGDELVLAYQTAKRNSAIQYARIHSTVFSDDAQWEIRSRQALQYLDRMVPINSIAMSKNLLAFAYNTILEVLTTDGRGSCDVKLPANITDIAVAEDLVFALNSDPVHVDAFTIQQASHSLSISHTFRIALGESTYLWTLSPMSAIYDPSQDILSIQVDRQHVTRSNIARHHLVVSFTTRDHKHAQVCCAATKILDYSRLGMWKMPLPRRASFIADSVCTASNHIFSTIMSTHMVARPLVHTRVRLDGTFVSHAVQWAPAVINESDGGNAMDEAGVTEGGTELFTAWDEPTRRLFLVTTTMRYTPEYEGVHYLVVAQF